MFVSYVLNTLSVHPHLQTGHIRALHMPMEDEAHMERGLASLTECLRIQRAHFPENDFNIANTRKMLGQANKRRGVWHEAREHLEACLPGFIQHFNINYHHVQFLTLELVAVLMEEGKYHDAIDLVSTSLANALVPKAIGDDYAGESVVLDLLYKKYECFAKACRLDDRIDQEAFDKLRQTFDEMTRELSYFSEQMKGQKRYIDVEEGLQSIRGTSAEMVEDCNLLVLAESEDGPSITRAARKRNKCYPFL